MCELVCVRVYVCVCVCACGRVLTVFARGRKELMMAAARFMRDVLHKEASL